MDYHVDGAIYKTECKCISAEIGDLVERIQFARIARKADPEILAP